MKTALFIFAFAASVALMPVTALRAQSIPVASPSPLPLQSAPPADNAPPPIPSPKPAPDDPKLHKLAVQQFLAWQSGTVDRSKYSDDVNAQLNDELLDASEKAVAALGALQSTTFDGISTVKTVKIYVYTMTCQHGSIDMKFALQPDGKIALIFFT